jgi:hypothetical protein
MRWLVVLALVACTHHEKPVAKDLETPVATKQPPDAGPPPACPATRAGLDGTPCSVEQACEYADASCGCEKQGGCTGSVTAWKHAQEHPTYAWSCRLKVRPDGCPGIEPNRNWPCTKEGQVCEYAECISRTFACRGGKWQLEHQGEPPP